MLHQDRPAGGLGNLVDGIIKRLDQNMGIVCLISLTFQTTFIMLFLRYSKVGVVDKYVFFLNPCQNLKFLRYRFSYIASVAVVAVEFVKVIFCTVVVFLEFRGKAFKEIFSGSWLHAVKLAVPSILYSFLNNLVHYGLARLQLPHFQVILTSDGKKSPHSLIFPDYLSNSYFINCPLLNVVIGKAIYKIKMDFVVYALYWNYFYSSGFLLLPR